MRAVLRVVNRVLVGIVGLVLLVIGGSVLAVGLGAPAPSWWIHDDRHDVLLSDAERTRWRDDGWWWPTVLAVLAVLVLLALWWLTANLRRRRLTEVLVDTGDGEGALLRGRALENVLASEAAGLEGVQRAHVHLTGRRSAPEARVRLLLEPHVDPGTALNDLTGQALAHARNSAGLAELPTEVRLRGVKHRAERVS
ncbi:alkaline shock response membrane anchor protein AmaP [Streptomyces sp. NPDC051243]|uniref:alkaline shock response membrane anchor protein AmaP n=1 Tax=Streptomyces sp. NPDC051243 TaxID=3365646 RepID=UPI00379BAA0A